MKKVYLIITILLSILCLTGCKEASEEVLKENMKKLELTGNLVTYQVYYHNVLEYEKKPGSGIEHWFEIKRMLFAEYTGTIKLGINLSKVKINVTGNTINVVIPKTTIIGEPNVDKNDFSPKNFIVSRDSWLNSNPITADDSAKAFDEAQQSMKNSVLQDTELLATAQKRAKILIEENINQFSGMSKGSYTIKWEYEQ